MGQVSKVHVPYGTDVLLPIYKRGKISDDCTPYEVCQCTHSGNFGKTCERINCQRKDNCRMDDSL